MFYTIADARHKLYDELGRFVIKLKNFVGLSNFKI